MTTESSIPAPLLAELVNRLMSDMWRSVSTAKPENVPLIQDFIDWVDRRLHGDNMWLVSAN